MRHRFAIATLAAVTVACSDSPLESTAPRVLSAIGAHNATAWWDASVPGSMSPRPGSNLPIYFVCPVEGDETARAAAILSDANLRLFADGTAEIRLQVGTWARVSGMQTATNETITRWGQWSDVSANEIAVSGFGIPGLGGSIQHTELGHAELSITLPCPSASSVPAVQPTLSLSLGQ